MRCSWRTILAQPIKQHKVLNLLSFGKLFKDNSSWNNTSYKPYTLARLVNISKCCCED